MSIEEVIEAKVRVAVREEMTNAIRVFVAEMKPVGSGEYLSPNDAGAVAHVHPDTIRLWIKSGRLPAFRAGDRRLRVKREDLDRFLCSPPPNEGGPSADEVAAAALKRRKGKR